MTPLPLVTGHEGLRYGKRTSCRVPAVIPKPRTAKKKAKGCTTVLSSIKITGVLISP